MHTEQSTQQAVCTVFAMTEYRAVYHLLKQDRPIALIVTPHENINVTRQNTLTGLELYEITKLVTIE